MITALPASAMLLPSAAPPVLADSDVGKGSPIGLLVVLLLAVAVYFLYRSMNRHLRNVPGRFDQPGEFDQSGEQEPGRPDRTTQEPTRQEPGTQDLGTQDLERRPDVPEDKPE